MPNNESLIEILTSNTSGSSNPYDIPREVVDSNTYSIPSSIPAVDYANHAIAMQVSVESPVPPPHASERSVYQHPRQGRSSDDGGRSSAVDGSMDLKVESGDYIYMGSIPGSQGGEKEASFSAEEVYKSASIERGREMLLKI